ncbi:MAG: hypothetical protein M1819_001124 [Sarea resinae]|nr:MAG: hypothetical protein M1819_001124 [Sarea resinae]
MNSPAPAVECSSSTHAQTQQSDPLTKKQQKFAAKRQAKQAAKANRAATAQTAPPPPDKTCLFQRLGCDMADRLVNHDKSGQEPLDLVERLNPLTPVQMVTSSTRTTQTTTVTETTTTTLTTDAFTANSLNTDNPPSSTHGSTISPKYKTSGLIFTLDDFAAMEALEQLVERHGRVSHMGILDKSYSFFVNKARDGALYFKVKQKVAVVGGDPLCHPSQFGAVLTEFEEYRKQFKWGLAFLGATDDMKKYAEEKKWVTMHFGEERVLNPLNNPVLFEKSGKRIIMQNKQLLDPKRGGVTLDAYSPAQGRDPQLQEQLVNIYDAWRAARNQSGTPQAYITVYDPFALPDLMTYIYTKDREGKPNGFAALRKLGANIGYHIDPCIAAPGAPRGISDLLIFSAMALLNKAGISYLSFGFEPLMELGEITGMAKPIAKITRTMYRHAFQGLPIGGKKEYHDKFHPDEQQRSGLYLVFPQGVPSLRQTAAVIHIANISVRQLISTDLVKPARAALAARMTGREKKKDDERYNQRTPDRKSSSEKSDKSSTEKLDKSSIEKTRSTLSVHVDKS